GFYFVGGTAFALTRKAGQGFDNPNFDDAGHRGHILVWYMD
ncbi:unnamed protein product, partial [marine sediment metagenome]